MDTKRAKSVTIKFTAEEWSRIERAAAVLWDARTITLLKAGVITRDFTLRCADALLHGDPYHGKKPRKGTT